MASLLYVGLEMAERASQGLERRHFLIQSHTLLQNVLEILDRKQGEINSSEGLEMLIDLPIELESEEIDLSISFDSAAKGVNPNNFLKKGKKRTIIDSDFVLLFDRILQTYNVQNKELFIALIEDTLDKDLDERIPGSELALTNRRFAQGAIENRAKFDMLIEAYIRLTEDPNILSVPWEEILSFYAPQIDLNYISPTLLRLILPYLDEGSVKRLTVGRKRLYKGLKDLPLAKEDREELKKYRVSPFVPVVVAKIGIRRGEWEGEIDLVYDIAEKRVLNIEEKIF